MALVKPQIARAVAARNNSPAYLVQRSVRQALFPARDPSLRDATEDSVGALTLDDLRSYYRAVFRPDLTTIVVIGNITAETARSVIEKHFGTWTATGPKPQTDLPPAPPNRAASLAVPDASRVQDNVVLSQNLALKHSDPDYYALSLGNAVLGGSFYSTRLSNDLRKNTGLVYSAGADLNVGRIRGVYNVGYACDPVNVGKAARIVVQDIKTKVCGAKKGNLEDPTRLGNVMYMRGLSYGIIVVEALRVAQAKYGKGKVMTPEQLRWGFEHLDLNEARLKELGAPGLFPPIKTSCADHEGSGMVKFQVWDGTGFKQVAPFMAGDREMVRKMVEETAGKYAAEKKITPRDCSKEM